MAKHAVLAVLVGVIGLSSVSVLAETVKVGPYSGKPGYFVRMRDSQTTMDALVMNADVALKLGKLKFEKLGGTLDCEVEGMQQSTGAMLFYSIFSLKNCK